MQVQSLGWEDPLEKEMATTPVLLPMNRGAWWAMVHGSAESQTRLKQPGTHIQGERGVGPR